MAAYRSFLFGAGLLTLVLLLFARHASAAFTESTAPERSLSTASLLANVGLSQGLFGLALLGLAWYSAVPAAAFGLSMDTVDPAAIALGVGVGVCLAGLNEAVDTVARRRWNHHPDDRLRAALTPTTPAGWLVLLLVVLPVIAGVEELLFRGALVGVAAVGTGYPPWMLAVGSSVAFALGHRTQGRLGVAVAGLLGLGLAAVFVLTGSLLVVIVAHYVVNVSEFIRHERFGVWR